MAEQLLLSWVDALGTEWPLNGETDYFAEIGALGLTGMPPMLNTEARTPLTDGAVLRYSLADVRVVDLPVIVKASSYSGLYSAARALAEALNPKNGTGVLRITMPDGTLRDLTAIYDSGFEHDLSADNSGGGFLQCVLVFRAQDPYWYDTQATVQTFAASPAPNFFPILPMVLGTSSVLSNFSINNAGSVDAYPLWIIKGPGSGITLTNNTTGKSLALTANGGLTLLSTDTLTIDTQAKTVTLQDGSSQYAHLTFASSLWTLARGFNSISVVMGGTSAGSSVQIQYKQRYLGA